MNCTKCGKDIAKVGTYKGSVCKTCRTKVALELRHKYRSKGLCRCGRACSGGKLCDGCQQKMRDYYNKNTLREDVLRSYGGVCVCCGERRSEFLTIDHIIPIGNRGPKHLRSGHGLYSWLRSHGYPPEFRLLCYNCNCSRGHAGYCPHDIELGFVEFSVGGRTHYFLDLDGDNKKLLGRIIDCCTKSGTDAASVVSGLVESCALLCEEKMSVLQNTQ